MSTNEALTQLEARLGYTFSDRDLLRRALTHRSWVEERSPGGKAPSHQSQQRLEFLGDALLGYVVGRWVYEQLPTAGEGELTERRKAFTEGGWLAAKGASLGLGALVEVGRGEAANTANLKLDEDTAEAVLGAILLDGGDEAAVRVIRSWLPPELPPPGPRDPIVRFNEWFQGKHGRSPEPPEYESTGTPHALRWTARRALDGVAFEGYGSNKADANRDLCAAILEAHPKINVA